MMTLRELNAAVVKAGILIDRERTIKNSIAGLWHDSPRYQEQRLALDTELSIVRAELDAPVEDA
jgi:hypothetical protein